MTELRRYFDNIQRLREQRPVRREPDVRPTCPDTRVLVEAYRDCSGAMSTLRDANRRLTEERDRLRAELQELRSQRRGNP